MSATTLSLRSTVEEALKKHPDAKSRFSFYSFDLTPKHHQCVGVGITIEPLSPTPNPDEDLPLLSSLLRDIAQTSNLECKPVYQNTARESRRHFYHLVQK